TSSVPVPPSLCSRVGFFLKKGLPGLQTLDPLSRALFPHRRARSGDFVPRAHQGGRDERCHDAGRWGTGWWGRREDERTERGHDRRAAQELRLLRPPEASLRRKEPLLAVLPQAQAVHPQREEEKRPRQGYQVRPAPKKVGDRGVGGSSLFPRRQKPGLGPRLSRRRRRLCGWRRRGRRGRRIRWRRPRPGRRDA
ncbi:unnamed protein product, partial [Scytosiphon promiscuus]